MRYLITLLPLVIAAAALAPSVRVIDGDTLDLSGERIGLWHRRPRSSQSCQVGGRE